MTKRLEAEPVSTSLGGHDMRSLLHRCFTFEAIWERYFGEMSIFWEDKIQYLLHRYLIVQAKKETEKHNNPINWRFDDQNLFDCCLIGKKHNL